MAQAKKQNRSGVQEGRIHNPGDVLPLVGQERKPNMAAQKKNTKKKPSGSSRSTGKKKNTGSSSSGQATSTSKAKTNGGGSPKKQNTTNKKINAALKTGVGGLLVKGGVTAVGAAAINTVASMAPLPAQGYARAGTKIGIGVGTHYFGAKLPLLNQDQADGIALVFIALGFADLLAQFVPSVAGQPIRYIQGGPVPRSLPAAPATAGDAPTMGETYTYAGMPIYEDDDNDFDEDWD